jgi:hypothetical protein
MCDYKILAHNEDGYIILCNSCSHYQVAFGTTIVTLAPNNFKSFFKQVNKYKGQTNLTGYEKQKRISLDIFTVNSMMVLSYAEVLKLSGLLSESIFNEEFEDLFRDLNVSRE